MRQLRMIPALAVASLLALSACGAEPTPQDTYWASLTALCGNAYRGEMTAGSEGARESFGAQEMIMHVRHCSDDEILIPFHVGENRSRTWVMTRLEDGGIRLKHDHRHEDGTEDDVTMYGGDALPTGTATVQEFPSDAESNALFLQERLFGGELNVWNVEVHPGEIFAYQLRRTGEDDVRIRVEFDLNAPVPAPPAAWGHE